MKRKVMHVQGNPIRLENETSCCNPKNTSPIILAPRWRFWNQTSFPKPYFVILQESSQAIDDRLDNILYNLL